MNRMHLALNTNRLDESVAFYSKLFGQPPAKLKPGWAKFDLLDPPLNLTLNLCVTTPERDAISHMGIEVGSSDEVHRMDKRLQEIGLKTAPEENVTCCYAVQDKIWVEDPNGHAWEFFYVKEDAPESGAETQAAKAPGCC